MKSHALAYLAPAFFLVASGPMPPPVARPRADARTHACTAAHLAIHTAAATPETFASSLACRHHATHDNHNSSRRAGQMVLGLLPRVPASSEHDMSQMHPTRRGAHAV